MDRSLGALLFVPFLHPLLIPVVGVPSHLLWWVHVLPLAALSYRCGRACSAAALAVSTVLVVLGERWFGAGYGVAADWPTVWALAVAVTATNLLVAGFSLYARRSARRYQVRSDSAINGVIRTDAELRIQAANPASLP